MSTCISKIRKHVASLSPGALFSTQDCVQYGSRSAVDQAIGLLIKLNIIDRIVRGVFVEVDSRKYEYSAEEVATVKTRAFGNAIVHPGLTCARELGVDDDFAAAPENSRQGEDSHVFLTSGHSTRFRFGEGYIFLRKCNGRKIQLSDSHVGKTIRALWYRQQSALTVETIYTQISSFDRSDFIELVSKARLMPAWLRDKISDVFCMRWQRVALSQIVKQREYCLIDSG
ncbi:MAG: hypothetical protein WC028_31405 [Candidatus Obscuribacterales bacterium]